MVGISLFEWKFVRAGLFIALEIYMNTKSILKPFSTSLKLKTLGGETKTYILEGTVVGFVFGLVLAVLIILSYRMTDAATISSIQPESEMSIYPVVIAALCFVFWIFAGALVGIGIPKMNLNPDQGRIEKWKISRTQHGVGSYAKVYNPEKNRDS